MSLSRETPESGARHMLLASGIGSSVADSPTAAPPSRACGPVSAGPQATQIAANSKVRRPVSSMRVNRPQCARVPYSAESLVRVEASWYGRTLRAIPEVLSQVGYQQADHGESLLTSHHCCLGAAEGARPGWVGSSAGALSGLLDSWAEASTAHAARIGDHSYGMHLAAVGFAEMEEHNAAALAAVYPTGGGSARCDGVDVS